MEYNGCMTVSRDSTSSSVSFLNYAREDAITYFPPYFFIYSSLAIHSFLAIRKWTLKLVPSAYDLLPSANSTRCLHSLDTFMHSSNPPGDVWSSKVDNMWDCTTLCWDSSSEMFCIFPFRLSPCSLGTWSSYWCGEAGGLSSWWWGMRWMSCSNSCCSMSISICSSACSVFWAKSYCCDFSPYLLDANCSNE